MDPLSLLSQTAPPDQVSVWGGGLSKSKVRLSSPPVLGAELQAAWTPCSHQLWFFTVGEALGAPPPFCETILARKAGHEKQAFQGLPGHLFSPLPNIRGSCSTTCSGPRWFNDIQRCRATGCEGSLTAGVKRWRRSQPHTQDASPGTTQVRFLDLWRPCRVPRSETLVVPSAALRPPGFGVLLRSPQSSNHQ